MSVRHTRLTLVIGALVLFLVQHSMVWAESAAQRTAFAISGGASKGAYEAGLNWGIIEISRKARVAEQLPLGGKVRPLEVTGISGTSAGGINTLLSALAFSVRPESQGGFANRIDDNIFRDVWLLPDVNDLLPPRANSPSYLAEDALLSRRTLVAAARALRDKWRQPGTFHPGMRIPMGVTVTRVEPETINIGGIEAENQRFFVPFEFRTQSDGSAEFGFDPGDYPRIREPDMILMPYPTDGLSYAISDQQMEDVVLTTSAFPIGFGRKRIQYCRQGELDSRSGSGDGTKSRTDAWRCPPGYVMAEAEFADGGLFDNLPIGLARRLSESGLDIGRPAVPVSYVYLDPDRRRYSQPDARHDRACDGDQPPDACRAMAFDLLSEAAVLGGALGTARKYELYRELTSDYWHMNLPRLAYQIADVIDSRKERLAGPDRLPFFETSLKPAEALRHTARLLERAYGYTYVPMAAPLSVEALFRVQTAMVCRPSSAPSELNMTAECQIDLGRLRNQLAAALVGYCDQGSHRCEELSKIVQASSITSENDRIIRVTSRGAPITGSLMGDFGAFLDRKFRDYDYYVGIYDAVVFIAHNQCGMNFSEAEQPAAYQTCLDHSSENLYRFLGLADDPKGRYVFGLLARREFGDQGGLAYAYDPMPPEHRDMRIIYEGLEKTLLVGRVADDPVDETLSVEREFFTHLKAEGFAPTPRSGGGTTLLGQIMEEPEYWAYELVNRATSRLVHLEAKADRVFTAQEPDPAKREKARTTLMGAGAYLLRTAAYNYPSFAFSPSTAPASWPWRNILPYEVSIDSADSDLLLLWQPTWNFNRNNLGVRFGFGFAGGLLRSRDSESRQHYGTLGIDYTRLTGSTGFSGWGVTPTMYHHWEKPESLDQTSFGFDVHALFFNNRLRVALGLRDVLDNQDDTWFLTLGLADLPGLWYWLSR